MVLKLQAISFLALLTCMPACSRHTGGPAAPSFKQHCRIAAEEGDTLTVAVISSRSVFGDVQTNIRHFERLIQDAAAKGARLVCFPELALTAYATSKAILKVAEPVPGRSTKQLADISRVNNVYISVGMVEKDRSQYYIAQVLVGPGGYIGKYRKHHPTSGEQSCGFSPGKEFPVWDIDGFRFGINICADGRQDDTIRAMKDAGVEVIHHPHGNWLGLGRDAEEWTRGKMVYFVPRAVFARAYVLINNSAGDTELPEGVSSFGSGAVVIDPLGQVMDRTTQKDREEKMVLVTLRKPLSDLIPEFEMVRLRRSP